MAGDFLPATTVNSFGIARRISRRGGSGMTQAEAAKVLADTQARVSDIKRGKISSFRLDMLVRLVARAGLNPKLKRVAQSAIPRRLSRTA